MKDSQRKAMFAKKQTPEQIKEESELKQMMRDAYNQTPKDKRSLTVISYKGSDEIHEKSVSLNKKDSSFEVAKQNLASRLKKQRTNGSTIGWKRNGVTVYRDKDDSLNIEWLKTKPDQWEQWKKYGFCDYDGRCTKFIVEDRNGKRNVYYRYSKPVRNDK